ncbi:MAG: ATP-dependent RNA helicase RhlB [Gammaproteobacteria bacterium]|nr:ATP-dependent RNA helicase RhlB [Gammaproteobacteria bacterium]
MEKNYLTDHKFTELELPEVLQRALQEANFSQCTAIQSESLPTALAGADVAGQAQTGSGKTIAFLLAAYNYLLKNPVVDDAKGKGQPRALMLAPTRELALQIHRDAEVIGNHAGFTTGLAYGGTGYTQQREALEKGVDILIATPGRMIDYFKQGVFRLDSIQVLVIDEADRMFELGFIKDIRFLLRRLPTPEKRLNLLFSATLSYRVLELAYEHMNNPQVIKVDADRLVVERVEEIVYYPANDEKIALLAGLLRRNNAERTLVFINTKHAAETIQNWLQVNGFSAGVMSGDVPQRQRERLLREFTEGKVQILVATDVAARGLHIPGVSHVFNFDLPQDAEDYVHRIGRTARAGASGDAISFACERYAFSLMDIEEYIGHSIPKGDITEDMLSTLEKPETKHSKRRQPSRQERGQKPQRKPKATARKTEPEKKVSERPAIKPAAQRQPEAPLQNESKVAPPHQPAIRPANKKREDIEIPAIG